VIEKLHARLLEERENARAAIFEHGSIDENSFANYLVARGRDQGLSMAIGFIEEILGGARK